MRSANEHLRACVSAVGQLPALAVQFADAIGCVLAEDVVSPGDVPVADVAECDGYALRAADAATRRVRLRVVDEIRAGATGHLRLVPGAAVLLASGALLPTGADAVVPVELTDGGDAVVELRGPVAVGQQVRRRAGDFRAGELVLAAGSRVGPRQVALLAALGRVQVSVHPRPRVVIISVGDELVEPGGRALPGEVFDANSHALASGVLDAGAVPLRVGAVPDAPALLRETLEDQLVRADLVITTGGLSGGPSDTVRDVIRPLGPVRFDDVALQPGRRFGLGHIAGEMGARVPIFCLPGDPVAVQVAYEAFVRPALRAMAGYPAVLRPAVTARVTRGWSSPPGVRQYVLARLAGSPAEGYSCEPVGEPGAAGLAALSRSNTFAVVAEEVTEVAAGDSVTCLVVDQ